MSGLKLEHSKLLTKLPKLQEKTKRRIKNLDSEIVTLYTFCFLKQNFNVVLFLTDVTRRLQKRTKGRVSLCNHTCYAFMSLQRLVMSLQGPNSFGFIYIMLLEKRKSGLDEKTIINDIVKLIYVFKNDLPDQEVAIFVLSSKLTPWKVIFIIQPPSPL